MRILHVSQPTSAGVANVLLGYVTDQVARGWEVHVAAPTTGYLLQSAGAQDATTHTWQATRSPTSRTVGETVRLQRILEEICPDVVHLHSSKAGLSGRLALRGRFPTIFQPHAWSYDAVTGPTRLATLTWERAAARLTSLTLCVSEAERDRGRKHHTNASRTSVVPNGIDLHRFAERDRGEARVQLGLDDLNGPLVVCVGRFAEQKGQDVLVAAWSVVRDEVPSARLALVGDDGGTTGDALRAMSGADAGISFHAGEHPELWYAAADVVAVPSRWEGMPLVVLEAMAGRRCLVASDVTGIIDATGPGHHLVPPSDPQALAGALIRRLRDEDLRESEASALLARATYRFDVNVTSAAVAQLVSSLLD